MEVEDVIVWLQTLTHIVCCIEGRRKPTHAGHDSLGEPVGNPLFTRNVEAGQQFTARLQGSQNLRVCLVLVGEYMEAVHAEHDIENTIFERQCSKSRGKKHVKISKILPKTKSLGKNCAFSTKKRGMLSIIVMTEATLLFHRGITLCHSIYHPKGIIYVNSMMALTSLSIDRETMMPSAIL